MRLTHVIANCNEEVEEPFGHELADDDFRGSRNRAGRFGKKEYIHRATLFHLHLHGSAPLERRPAPDDQSQVVRPQLRVTIRRVGVSISRTRENDAALNA